MTVRDVAVIGHRALHQHAKTVREVADEVRKLVADVWLSEPEAAAGVARAAI